jgi:hypothetical protein
MRSPFADAATKRRQKGKWKSVYVESKTRNV